MSEPAKSMRLTCVATRTHNGHQSATAQSRTITSRPDKEVHNENESTNANITHPRRRPTRRLSTTASPPNKEVYNE